ncbi:MAG TPA: CoA transferase [Xanthobacteraceae bacterium]|jgi:crotonobetainyl-CoA:carnitine CoA-transferase CaiB-like acyl-CoA transferase|nr:CoA transferase [Xanthobacteraceae bacterium]
MTDHLRDRPAGALAGVRIVDLTTVVLGPYATQMLGDLGADIIKVEGPDGDTTRHTGPRRSPGMASLFLGANRNKRSIALDLKAPAARDVLKRLIDSADVFVHNIRPQKLARLGFGPDVLMARRPRLIYAAIHGWRQDGPYGGRPAYDDIIQGFVGVAGLMEILTGEPRYMPTILADKTCGLMAAQAVLAALFHREKTGRGQVVEIPMFETMVSYLMIEHLYGATFVPPEGDMGYARVLAPWRRPYRTADGRICMLAYTDRQWRRFWDAAGRPAMMHDPRFADLAARTRHIDELYRLAGEALATRTTSEWLAILDDIQIPAGPVNALADLPNDPHLAAIGFFRHVNHPTEGAVVMPDVPLRFSDSPAEISRLPPRLGEHGREILGEIGLSREDIDALAAAGALVLPESA